MRSSIKIVVAATVLSVIGLVSCSDQTPYGKPLLQTHDLSNKTFPVKVMTFANESSLNRYLKNNNLEQKEVLGLAAWSVNKNDRTAVSGCTIYVVDPKGLNDRNRFETWGHELVHCVYGSFHEEAH